MLSNLLALVAELFSRLRLIQSSCRLAYIDFKRFLWLFLTTENYVHSQLDDVVKFQLQLMLQLIIKMNHDANQMV
jgi:hypothetical protein